MLDLTSDSFLQTLPSKLKTHFSSPRPAHYALFDTRITCCEEYKSENLRKIFEPKREEVTKSVKKFHNQELRDF
jgi:hypothetical protein